MKPYVLATMTYKNGRKETKGHYGYPKEEGLKWAKKYARLAFFATGMEPTMPNMHLCVNGFCVLIETKKIMNDAYIEERISEYL